MLKKNKKILTIAVLIMSIIMNIYWGITFYYSKKDKIENFSYLDQKSPDCLELFNKTNYQKIFIEKNDSTYREYFNRFFVNTPGQSFLLACTFYLLSNDKKIKRDIQAVLSEMKGMYGTAPDIELLKTSSK